MASPVRTAIDSVTGAGGRWRVAWDVTNVCDAPLHVDDAWVPHGRFRGEGHVPLSISIGPGQTGRVELNVTSSEGLGTVVANAFLILYVRSPVESWRVFVRMRIEFVQPSGAPTPVVEVVTAQSA